MTWYVVVVLLNVNAEVGMAIVNNFGAFPGTETSAMMSSKTNSAQHASKPLAQHTFSDTL